jgi:hypothetical protein
VSVLSLPEPPGRPRVLVLIPGTVNYFYDQAGQRLAESLRALNMDVNVSTLSRWPEGEYEFCFLSNIPEILFAFGNETGGLEQLRAVRQRCRVVASCAIDCVQTPWYQRVHQLSERCEVDCILDLGLHDQSRFLAPALRSLYRFVFSGLTPSEQQTLAARPWNDDERSLPWAFVGHNTPYRVALVDHLLQMVDPRGFVYVPELSPYKEKGSPHLNQEQYAAVLARTRYQVWCSHHAYFYMEPERFRTSLLTGSVPVQIIDSEEALPRTAHFHYLMMERKHVGERLTTKVFQRVRARFEREWQAFPTLAEELARVLGVPPSVAKPGLSQAA